MELWQVDHYEQNEDHRELNDHAAWTAHKVDGKQFLACANDNTGETIAIEVQGDLVLAKIKLQEETGKDLCWPSLWLGPQSAGEWDEVCEALGLTRVGEPLDDFEDQDD